MPVKTTPDRVLTIEELFRERLVHYRDAAFLLVFVVAKVTAAQRNAHHFEITGPALDWDRDRQSARTFELRAFYIDRAVVVIQSQRKIIGQRGVLDLRQRLRMLQHLLLKRAATLLI